MKIKKLNGSSVMALDFTPSAPGKFTALVPLSLKAASDMFESDASFSPKVRMDIQAEQQTNKVGRTRVMLKVTVPYSAATGLESFPSAIVDSTTAQVARLDPKRSGGEMSAHIVFSAPKAFVEDFKGTNGSLAAGLAAAQAELLLRALLSSFSELSAPGATGDQVNSIRFDTDTGLVKKGGMGNRVQSLELFQDGTTGVTGVRLGANARLSDLNNRIGQALVRGINGLDPLTDSMNLVMPTGKYAEEA